MNALDRDEAQAIAWQCTAEIARQAALLWYVASDAMPPGPARQLVADCINQINQLTKWQDQAIAKSLAPVDRGFSDGEAEDTPRSTVLLSPLRSGKKK